MTTFAHETGLPALPLPRCDTLPAILPGLLAPLVDKTILDKSLHELQHFLAGDGAKLEQALKEWQGQQPGNASWLNALWEKDYLSFAEPLPINMNYFFLLDEKWHFSAGGLLSALVTVMQRLSRQELPPEMVKESALSMHQFRTMWYSRLPMPHCDTLHTVPLGGLVTATVVCNGHWHILPLSDASGQPFTARAIETALDALRTASLADKPAPLGALTTANRNVAIALRANLLASEQNRLNLAALENSAIVICLDDAVDGTTNLCRNALCGPSANRWYAKSIQLICPQNGPLGLNFEHAGCDASAWGHLLTMATKTIRENNENQPYAHGSPKARPLLWSLSEEVEMELQRLEAAHTAQVQALDLCVIGPDPRFGKESIKALKCSPDAFVQMAMQYAQLAVFGEFVSCYEAFSMRHFAQGRTECARPSSLQAKTLAQAIDKEKDSLGTLFAAAAEEHGKRLALCHKGEAIERLLYGLKQMYALYGNTLGIETKPAFFNDPGLVALGHNRLSTSSLAIPFVSHFGFGPVEPDGLGTGYLVQTDAVSLVITGFKGSSPKACDFASAFIHGATTQAMALTPGE